LLELINIINALNMTTATLTAISTLNTDYKYTWQSKLKIEIKNDININLLNKFCFNFEIN